MSYLELGYLAQTCAETIGSMVEEISNKEILEFLLKESESRNHQPLRLLAVEFALVLRLPFDHRLRPAIDKVSRNAAKVETSRGTRSGAALILCRDELFSEETPHEALIRNINSISILAEFGKRVDVLKTYRNALRHCRKDEEVQNLSKYWARLAKWQITEGRTRQAKRSITKAGKYFQIHGQPESHLGVILDTEAKIAVSENRLEDALVLLEKAMSLFLKHGRIQWYAYSLRIRVRLLGFVGEFVEATNMVEEAIDELSLLDNDGVHKALHLALGQCLLNTGRLDEAESALQYYTSVVEVEDSPQGKGFVSHMFAELYLNMKRYDLALINARKSVAAYELAGDTYSVFLGKLKLAQAEFFTHDENAQATILECQRLLKEQTNDDDIGTGNLALATVFEGKGEFLKALEYARQAHTAAKNGDYGKCAADSNLVSARLCIALGRPNDAKEFALDALEFFDDKAVQHAPATDELIRLLSSVDESAREFLSK